MSGQASATAGIQQAIAAYAQALDDGRTDDVIATFCEDGAAEFPGSGKIEGHAALRATYSQLVPRAPQRHVLVNTRITTCDDDHATAVSDLVLFGRGEAGWSIGLVGRYDDALRCVNGKWLFQSRTLTFVE